MNKFLITYDLRSPGKDYSKLINYIKSFNCVKVTESCWIIKSDGTSSKVRDNLRLYIDVNDRLFVANLVSDCSWYNTLTTDEALKTFIEN